MRLDELERERGQLERQIQQLTSENQLLSDRLVRIPHLNLHAFMSTDIHSEVGYGMCGNRVEVNLIEVIHACCTLVVIWHKRHVMIAR
jgi:hypothetical protein